MKLIWLSSWLFFFVSSEVQAFIHASTPNFLDIELSKKHFLIDCSGNRKNDNSIVGFHLLDGETYYLFYYRAVRTAKRCHELRDEYMGLIKNQNTVRIVGNHPDESIMLDSDRGMSPAAFRKAKKMVSSVFVRLQAGNKCKAYFSEDCELPERYWASILFFYSP